MYFINKTRLSNAVTKFFAKYNISVATKHYNGYSIMGTSNLPIKLNNTKFDFFSLTLYKTGWIMYEFSFGTINVTPEVNALIGEFNDKTDFFTAYVSAKDNQFCVKYSTMKESPKKAVKTINLLLNKIAANNSITLLTKLAKYMKAVD